MDCYIWTYKGFPIKSLNDFLLGRSLDLMLPAVVQEWAFEATIEIKNFMKFYEKQLNFMKKQLNFMKSIL